MCIVIDVNAFAPVFNPQCDEHQSFKPVCNWILKGNGKFVYGGSKYKEHLARANTYRRLFLEMKKSRRAVEIDGEKINQAEDAVQLLVQDGHLDDAYIVAIFIVSHCPLFCSCDKRADKYVKDKTPYPKGHKPPKIYRGLNHKRLLCDANVVRLHHVI